MSQREVLIVLAHALSCPSCRVRLLNEPQVVLRGHALTDSEREMLAGLSDTDFITAELLARSAGVTAQELRGYGDYGVVRLRHF